MVGALIIEYTPLFDVPNKDIKIEHDFADVAIIFA